jgi:hypothetical protein
MQMTLQRKRFYKSGGASYTVPGVGGYIYIDPRIVDGTPPDSIVVDVENLKAAQAELAEKQAARDSLRAQKAAQREAKLADRADKLAAKAKKAQEIADRAKAAADKIAAARAAAGTTVAEQPFTEEATAG